MLKATLPLALLVTTAMVPRVLGQAACNEQAMQQIQRQQTLQPADDLIVQACVEARFEALRSGGDAQAFRAQIARWRDSSESTPQFLDALAREYARQATTVFGNETVAPAASAVVAASLAEFDQRVPIEPMLAGLRSPAAGTRYLMAKSIASRRATYGANPAQLAQVAQAVVSAAAAEQESAVLAWLYKSLAVPGMATNATILDALITIFHGRVEARRTGTTFVDGADIEALEYLRGAAGSLPQNDRNRLLPDLAAYLRIAGERFAADDLQYREQVSAERALDAAEAVLAGITGNAGGVRAALASGERKAVLGSVQQAITAWIGDPNTAGVLNGGNYGVERGAP